MSSLEFYNQAVAVKQVTDKYHIPLIINDRIDIAMAVQATGVHIGQHDLPAAAVRKVIGENMLLGVSASSIAEAIQAQQDGADYLGVGAMFPTGTKTDADSVSMEELQKIRAAVSLPIVVIGGINKGNAGRFKPMGIDGLAVVSAIIAQKLKRRQEKETLFCELPEIVVENLAVWDDYETDYTIFNVCGYDIRVYDDELAEALKQLSERNRETLLMYYFLEMNNEEIAKKQNISRSGVFQNRHNSLALMKKLLKEKQ